MEPPNLPILPRSQNELEWGGGEVRGRSWEKGRAGDPQVLGDLETAPPSPLHPAVPSLAKHQGEFRGAGAETLPLPAPPSSACTGCPAEMGSSCKQERGLGVPASPSLSIFLSLPRRFPCPKHCPVLSPGSACLSLIILLADLCLHLIGAIQATLLQGALSTGSSLTMSPISGSQGVSQGLAQET